MVLVEVTVYLWGGVMYTDWRAKGNKKRWVCWLMLFLYFWLFGHSRRRWLFLEEVGYASLRFMLAQVVLVLFLLSARR